MQNTPLEAALDEIISAFRPEPITCQINGKTYFIERIPAGWCWRNEDGDCQEDFGSRPFKTPAEAQQDAMRIANPRSLIALHLRRNHLVEHAPTCNLAAPLAEKQVYEERVQVWLAAMQEIDRLIAAARKAAA